MAEAAAAAPRIWRARSRPWPPTVPPTFPPLPHPATAEPQNTGREKGFGKTRVWFRLPQRGIDWTKQTASGEEEEEIDNEERDF